MSALGTEFKINVHVDPITVVTKEGQKTISMYDYDFECDFFVNRYNKVTIHKYDMKCIDNNNYLAIIDKELATKLGRGHINMELTARIPDADFEDEYRIEKAVVCTDITII